MFHDEGAILQAAAVLAADVTSGSVGALPSSRRSAPDAVRALKEVLAEMVRLGLIAPSLAR